ncbi:MAG: hypothetical protein H6739_04375 [Alphaproteobacteria bacterium]|nr:hypothetical protein [Alphaproteobacteria bacterium]
MIHYAPPDAPLDRALLDAPGGFAWWYVDLVDDQGSGLVLIWSFGLPFLPGYAGAAREGHAQAPRSRPSINLALYTRGRPDCYVLQEYAPDQVVWEPGTERCVFGDSVLETAERDGIREVRADLVLPLPGTDTPLEARLLAAGPACRAGGPLPGFGGADRAHAWTPLLTACTGSASLRVGNTWATRLEGRLYHDRNGSARPLHDLGIDHWIWGRVAAPDGERVVYLVWGHGEDTPAAAGFEVDADGGLRQVPELEVELEGPRRHLYGMRDWRALTLNSAGAPWLRLSTAHLLDNGPFYLRYLLDAELPDRTRCRGIGEAVRPDRVDLVNLRPFVRMRVHRLRGLNEPLLPLFTGPRRGRLGRLWTHVVHPEAS